MGEGNRNRVKGQATIELLMILVVLFVILTFSIHLYQQRVVSVGGVVEVHEASKTAQLVSQYVERVLQSPIGSRVTLFVPPSENVQTISIADGTVSVSVNQTYVSVPISGRGFETVSFFDGNTIVLERTPYGVKVSDTLVLGGMPYEI